MAKSFLEALRQPRPDPGGGAAAAYGALLGLALLEKVGRLEAERSGEAEPRQEWREVLARLRDLIRTFGRLRQEDVQAYASLVQTRGSADAPARLAALREAVQCPLRIVQAARNGLELLSRTGEHCQPHLVPDLLVAAEFLNAALMGAYHIACANLPLVKEARECAVLARELVQVCQPACELFQQVKMELVARTHDRAACR